MPIWQPGMRQQRLEMIETAMKETSPRVYRHIKYVEKELPEFLKLTERALIEEFELATDQMTQEVLKKNLPPVETQQQIEMGTRAIWETALANHLEFPESLYLPDETTEYQPEE